VYTIGVLTLINPSADRRTAGNQPRFGPVFGNGLQPSFPIAASLNGRNAATFAQWRGFSLGTAVKNSVAP
jgi:hypothetical protein